MAEVQNLKNHARIVPMFHIGVLLILIVNIVASIIHLFSAGISFATILQVLVAIALFLMAISLRTQILTVQDRVIRMEMRMRLVQLLPPALHGSIGQLSAKQLVALRFASDSELPALVQKVVGGELATQKAIKTQIKEWQGDFLRA